ncbi:hypothetical protein POUND7_008413 [Theobroma cacao]
MKTYTTEPYSSNVPLIAAHDNLLLKLPTNKECRLSSHLCTVFRSSPMTHNSYPLNGEVGDVLADREAVPSFNPFHSLEDINSIFLDPIRGGNAVMSQHRIPYGGLLDLEKPYDQSIPCSCLDDPNFQTPDFKSFNYYNYCLGMNIQPHNLGHHTFMVCAPRLVVLAVPHFINPQMHFWHLKQM